MNITEIELRVTSTTSDYHTFLQQSAVLISRQPYRHPRDNASYCVKYRAGDESEQVKTFYSDSASRFDGYPSQADAYSFAVMYRPHLDVHLGIVDAVIAFNDSVSVKSKGIMIFHFTRELQNQFRVQRRPCKTTIKTFDIGRVYWGHPEYEQLYLRELKNAQDFVNQYSLPGSDEGTDDNGNDNNAVPAHGRVRNPAENSRSRCRNTSARIKKSRRGAQGRGKHAASSSIAVSARGKDIGEAKKSDGKRETKQAKDDSSSDSSSSESAYHAKKSDGKRHAASSSIAVSARGKDIGEAKKSDGKWKTKQAKDDSSSDSSSTKSAYNAVVRALTSAYQGRGKHAVSSSNAVPTRGKESRRGAQGRGKHAASSSNAVPAHEKVPGIRRVSSSVKVGADRAASSSSDAPRRTNDETQTQHKETDLDIPMIDQDVPVDWKQAMFKWVHENFEDSMSRYEKLLQSVDREIRRQYETMDREFSRQDMRYKAILSSLSDSMMSGNDPVFPADITQVGY